MSLGQGGGRVQYECRGQSDDSIKLRNTCVLENIWTKQKNHENKSRGHIGPCLPADWNIPAHFVIAFSKCVFHYKVETVSNTLSQSTVNRDKFEAPGGRYYEEGFTIT